MREIKFRVWDSRVNKMIYFDLLHSCGMCPPDCLENVQQFTGLKDKNGKEIYEGDILALYQDHTKFISSVVYSVRDAYFKVASANSLSYYRTGYIDFEVIGNIFENEDLVGLDFALEHEKEMGKINIENKKHMTTVNINDQCQVILTKYGCQQLVHYYTKLYKEAIAAGSTTAIKQINKVEAYEEGDVYKDCVWSLINIFGEACCQGAEIFFENNEIIIDNQTE